MYRFKVEGVRPLGNNYYLVNLSGIKVDKTDVNSNFSMTFMISVINVWDYLPRDIDNILQRVKNYRYEEPTENLVVTIEEDSNSRYNIQFFSTDLDDYIDAEVRTKFPNEDVVEVKIQLIKDILEYIKDKGEIL